MVDLFEDKATDWDARPVPTQISAGVGKAILERVTLKDDMQVLDFGAGTGLVCAQLAPRVARVYAVDISAAMLAQLAAKQELQGKVEAVCQDLLQKPLGYTVDLVVSAMAMHHVQDTQALLTTLAAHLQPGGQLALADLDTEDGSFHPPDVEGVFHQGFDREQLGEELRSAGFVNVAFTTAVEVQREGKGYPVFLVTATRA